MSPMWSRSPFGDAEQDDGEKRKLGVEAFEKAGEPRDDPEQKKRGREDERHEEEDGVDEGRDHLLLRGFAELQVAGRSAG